MAGRVAAHRAVAALMVRTPFLMTPAESLHQSYRLSITTPPDRRRDDFGDILTAAGVPDIPVQKSTETKKWSEGEEFNASTFNYQQYEKDFLKK